MRSIWRTLQQSLDKGLARDIALVCLADGVVGLSYGAISVGGGLDLWVPVLLSVVVFAGASQFLFVGIVAAGGSPIAATIAGLLVNSRHVAFGLAVSDVIGAGWKRLPGSHLMTDENVAFALGQDELKRKRAAYWICGIGIFICWNLGVLAGGQIGSVITDTDVFGLDAAFPAVLLALVLPSLRDKSTRTAAVAGVVVALAVTPFLPAGLPVLLALVGLVFYRTEQSPKKLPEAKVVV
ncbi:branched-chain amino acid ABC transporter permease [Kribbella qitaiheensis]|uniref:Branched-chain amino acid ABC transporter permease n=1 Tax=Kribbella qitaiheensis TaxID=1544730 RepID=A0A7G6X3W9_9ACTN|nr:AzlC family ABC transporter permease [Kribbella qitaiheensis]QNE20934.1 branched-chain amino acid ABC transporter permease [Kribbella qitaiheensis]